MLDLMIEIVAFVLVLFFLVPFLFLFFWRHRNAHRGPRESWHSDHRTN